MLFHRTYRRKPKRISLVEQFLRTETSLIMIRVHMFISKPVNSFIILVLKLVLSDHEGRIPSETQTMVFSIW